MTPEKLPGEDKYRAFANKTPMVTNEDMGALMTEKYPSDYEDGGSGA